MYKLQISEYNIYYTNIIAMQNALIIAKILKKLSKKKTVLMIYLIYSLRKYRIQEMYC